jgi:RNA polymerase sigma-70 factor (ECF subfamily)
MVELARKFVHVAGRPLPAAELEQSLRALLTTVRSVWPFSAISDEVFVEHLAERVRNEESILDALAALHAADLFLACACLHGERAALAAFDHAFVERLNLGAKTGSSAFDSELKQALRERVLVGQRGAPPRLSSYSGRGPLSGWLKVAAARLAVDLRREQKLGTHAAERDVPLPPLDPELSYLKARYRVEFQEAIQAGFSALSPRELTLLRLHFLEQMPTASIARMYRVSARSVQRWIAAAQSAVVDAVRRDLHARLALTESELTSLLALVLSQLSVSLHRFLLEKPAT